MSSTEDILENISTIQDVAEVIRDPRLTAIMSTIKKEETGEQQRGGIIGPIFAAFQACMNVVFKVLIAIVLFIKDLIVELFYPLFWKAEFKNDNRALFWKYMWFCIKCGFYLLIFSIAGPIFLLIGVGMVYSKMLEKMGTDGPTLIRQRLSDARDL